MRLKNGTAMSDNNIDVSLIMPTYNKESRLKLVLASLKNLRHTENSEIIIVNDGSTDNTQSILEEFSKDARENGTLQVNIINIKNSGRSIARNIGIQASRGRLIIFSDDDLLLDPMFIHAHRKMHDSDDNLVVHGIIYSLPHLKFFKDPSTGILYDGGTASSLLMSKSITPELICSSGLEKHLSDNARISKFEKDINLLYKETSIEDSYVRWVGFNGGNVSVLKSNLEKVGLFDVKMGKEWGCEDLELGYRLYKAGLYFKYCETSKNYHINHYREGFIETHNSSMAYFIQKHNDESIKLLNGYFNNKLASLNEWKVKVDKLRECKPL